MAEKLYSAAELFAASSGIHDAIRISGPDSIVFNPAAGPVDLLAYAHGQMVILGEVLQALGRDAETGLYYSLSSILHPATEAVEIAAKQLLEKRHG